MIEKLPAQFSQAAGQLPAGGEEKAVARIEGIINSMTPAERSRPELLKAARKRRIALGAGVQVQEVNRLLKQFIAEIAEIHLERRIADDVVKLFECVFLPLPLCLPVVGVEHGIALDDVGDGVHQVVQDQIQAQQNYYMSFL